MRRTTVLLVRVLAVGVSLLGPSRVSGEPFLDLYGGVAETESASVTAQRRDCNGDFVFGFSCSPWTKAARRVDFDTAATFGGRAGYWFERAPWVGVAGDLSLFEAKGRDARFTIVPLSFLLMLRLPLLTTEDIPKGRLQPYVGVGPSVFHQDASVDFRPQVGKKVEIGSTAVGLDARVGESETFGIVSPAIERLDATLNTHHLTSGGLVPILIWRVAKAFCLLLYRKVPHRLRRKFTRSCFLPCPRALNRAITAFASDGGTW